MDSIGKADKKPHALCIPFPAQGHINSMFKLAKLLHYKGFHITFVNTEYNQRRLCKSLGLSSVDDLPGFRFETIPDGLPESDAADVTQDIATLFAHTSKSCSAPFCSLLTMLTNVGSGVPPVTCIVSDGTMGFTLDAAEQFRLPIAFVWVPSACAILAWTQYPQLIEKGYVPLPDMNCVTNGYLETKLEWYPGNKEMRLKDLPSFIRTTDPNDFMLNFALKMVEAFRSKPEIAMIVNTFDALEQDSLKALSEMFHRVYAIGPLQAMLDPIGDERVKSLSSSLWKEESGCMDWLENKAEKSVVYVNFGSITTVTMDQLREFAWGLADSGFPFLWIIRPDMVAGEKAVLPSEFVAATKDRGMLASWCPQEQVLKHPSIGGFLMHCGWNSTLDTICGGVPVICWPFFAEHQTICRYCCVEWGMGMEIDNNVKREEVEMLVRELMEGGKGKNMRKNAIAWKERAEEATEVGGSAWVNLDRLIKEVLLA